MSCDFLYSRKRPVSNTLNKSLLPELNVKKKIYPNIEDDSRKLRIESSAGRNKILTETPGTDRWHCKLNRRPV